MSHEAIHGSDHAPGEADSLEVLYASLDETGKVPAEQLPAAQSGSAPTGSGMDWYTDTPPEGWLLCDGAAVSRTTYAALFAVIGTVYGAGDGTTTFNLPDRRGRVGVGKDAGQTEFDALGETGGALTHQHASHVHTPAGTVSQPTVTINALAGGTRKGGTSNPGSIIENGNVPTGTVSQPTFAGQEATLTHDAVNHAPPYLVQNKIIKT